MERLLAGEPIDRQERYRQNLTKRGLTRISITVPIARVDEIRALATKWNRAAEGCGDD